MKDILFQLRSHQLRFLTTSTEIGLQLDDNIPLAWLEAQFLDFTLGIAAGECWTTCPGWESDRIEECIRIYHKMRSSNKVFDFVYDE